MPEWSFRLNLVDGIISYREVHIVSYDSRGLALKWTQQLVNTYDPDDQTVEFTYGGAAR